MTIKTALAAGSLLMALATSGCGLRGDLYLPDEAQEADEAVEKTDDDKPDAG